MKRSALVTFILIIVAAVGGYLYFFGTKAPAVSLVPDQGIIAATKKIALKVDAPRANLQSLTVSARQGERTATLVDRTFPPGSHTAAENFTLSAAKMQDGPLTVEVVARATAEQYGMAKTSRKQYSFTLENKPPSVAVLSTAHNIRRGGSALVVYTVSKEVEKTGVVFADRFFPGYRQGGNMYACLFPFPYDIEEEKYIPKVLAVDRAGNERLVTINYHLLPKAYPKDRITITDALLDKVAGEFRNRFPEGTPLEVFLRANRELRAEDSKTMMGVGSKTSATPLWQGSFVRMPNTATVGSFAQTRTYVYKGEEVDTQTHLGTDLASTIHAPVPAANDGKVVFADDLGLYGQCIIIDHGLGLQTLYGHLSQLSVKEGDTVTKGQIIGNSGTTGMAVGDHLHFGVNVSGEAVNPLEWWDPSWLQNNVTGKLQAAIPPAAPAGTGTGAPPAQPAAPGK